MADMSVIKDYIAIGARHMYDSTRGVIIIKEDDNPRYPKIEVIISANNYIDCFKMDCRKLGRVSPYLNDSKKGVLCMSDAVLIYRNCPNEQDIINVVVLEMKASTFKKNEIMIKHLNSKAFVNYIAELMCINQ